MIKNAHASTETFGRPIVGGSDQDKSWGLNAHVRITAEGWGGLT